MIWFNLIWSMIWSDLIWFRSYLIWFGSELIWFGSDLIWFGSDLIWFGSNLDLIWTDLVQIWSDLDLIFNLHKCSIALTFTETTFIVRLNKFLLEMFICTNAFNYALDYRRKKLVRFNKYFQYSRSIAL